MRGKTNPFPSSDYALLGLLVPGPCHGYELHKILSEARGIGLVWGVKMSNLYAQLDKLERKGMIAGELQEQDSHPNRRQYTLTAAGRESFQTWLEQPVIHPRELRQEFMLRYFFWSNYQPDKLQELIANQINVCEKWLSNTKEREISLKNPGTFENAVVHFRRTQIQSMVDWLKWLQIQPYISKIIDGGE